MVLKRLKQLVIGGAVLAALASGGSATAGAATGSGSGSSSTMATVQGSGSGGSGASFTTADASGAPAYESIEEALRSQKPRTKPPPPRWPAAAVARSVHCTMYVTVGFTI